jgi:quinol monooxygenase YgiN
MTPRHGIYVRFHALPGRGDELVVHLLAGIDSFSPLPACELCLVSRDPSDPDVVYVTEVWSSRADHEEFAARDDVQAFIRRVHALTAEPPRVTYMDVVSGLGLRAPALTG